MTWSRFAVGVTLALAGFPGPASADLKVVLRRTVAASTQQETMHVNAAGDKRWEFTGAPGESNATKSLLIQCAANKAFEIDAATRSYVLSAASIADLDRAFPLFELWTADTHFATDNQTRPAFGRVARHFTLSTPSGLFGGDGWFVEVERVAACGSSAPSQPTKLLLPVQFSGWERDDGAERRTVTLSVLVLSEDPLPASTFAVPPDYTRR